MHSLSVSIFNSISKRSGRLDSSTGFDAVWASGSHGTAPNARAFTAQNAELPYLPEVCKLRGRSAKIAERDQEARERKESIGKRVARDFDSNGKDTQNPAREALFKSANTFEIRLFADPKCQRSTRAVEVVMDRGAEGAARGCDAV